MKHVPEPVDLDYDNGNQNSVDTGATARRVDRGSFYRGDANRPGLEDV